MSTNDQARYSLEIQVVPDAAGGAYQAGGESVLADAGEAFAAAGASLAEAAAKFREKLGKAAPTEIELEARLLLKSETRWLIVAGGEASVSVKMKWVRTSSESGSW